MLETREQWRARHPGLPEPPADDAPRSAHEAYARRHNFFWLPCPVCRRMRGGHEWRNAGGIYKGGGTYRGVCNDPVCVQTSRLLSEHAIVMERAMHEFAAMDREPCSHPSADGIVRGEAERAGTRWNPWRCGICGDVFIEVEDPNGPCTWGDGRGNSGRYYELTINSGPLRECYPFVPTAPVDWDA